MFVVPSRYYRFFFYIGGSALEFVRQYSHLGHILSDDFDDASDINRGRVKLISQINVLCYFRKVDCFVRMRLLTTYCYSLYGCVLCTEALRYGTCSQGISQFYLHSHTYIRNRNEPYLPLPSQPQLVLIYQPRRDGRLS